MVNILSYIPMYFEWLYMKFEWLCQWLYVDHITLNLLLWSEYDIEWSDYEWAYGVYVFTIFKLSNNIPTASPKQQYHNNLHNHKTVWDLKLRKTTDAQNSETLILNKTKKEIPQPKLLLKLIEPPKPNEYH